MKDSKRPLLCELHAHTTWSDGSLGVGQLVDLYGRAGFDVLAVTDHVVREDRAPCIQAANHSAYLAEIEAEAERARFEYGLLVLPGLELTDDDPEPALAAHVVAVGLREFVGLGDGLDAALDRARAPGALLIGAHPYALETAGRSPRGTARLAEQAEWAAQAVHRLELVNRHDFFHWVARRLLPAVATGDFHVPEHLWTWKTVVACEQEERAVLDHLRSGQAVELTRIDPPAAGRRAA